MTSVIPVGLGDRSYDVLVGPGLLSELGARVRALKPGAKAAIVTDDIVGALYGAAARARLEAAGVATTVITMPPGESTKSFAGLEALCDQLLDFGLERSDVIVALGGGVIGDLAGLAAGLLKRGVDYVQIPTTLLAQVDSSVGGKTAIDTRAGKNLVGLFHQPRLVLADLTVLKTLPDRELRAGLAEVAKYGLIDDAAFFAWCVANSSALLTQDEASLAHAVGVSVRAKARIVAADEREAGARALLNLGHTFGHAIEAATGMDGAVSHGEAVAIGMVCAFDFSARLGLCSGADAEAVRAGLSALGLPVSLPAMARAQGVDAFVAAMMHDKKNSGGRLTLILATGIGAAFVQKNAPIDEVREFLTQSVFS